MAIGLAGQSDPTPIRFEIGGTSVAVAPQITAQPQNASVAAGGAASFSVQATGSPAPAYQWTRNGATLAGATAATLAFPSAQPADAGTYAVIVSNSAGTVTSASATLAVTGGAPTARLGNLSVRTAMAAGQTLIVGATVSGGAGNLLVRAAGPALAAFGLSGAMTDPRLELYDGATLTFENNDWPSNLAATFASVGAFGFSAGSRDAAFVRNISGGPTIQVKGTGAGVVLVEAYDLGPGGSARLVNVSARNRVGTGDDILIAGLNIAGTGTQRLLIRAVGPNLGAFGVTGFLNDPRLEVYNGAARIAENDNWTADLAATFSAVGAFPLDAGSRDAALVTTLPPGSYTVQVSGVSGGTGEALVEIYELP